jgi:hypothetical protein
LFLKQAPLTNTGSSYYILWFNGVGARAYTMVILDRWASLLLVSMIPGKPWEICSTIGLSFVCFTTIIQRFVRGTKNLLMISHIDCVHTGSSYDSFSAVFYSFTDIYDSANDVNTVIQFLITLRILQKSFLNLMHCCTILDIEHNENPKSTPLFAFSAPTSTTYMRLPSKDGL